MSSATSGSSTPTTPPIFDQVHDASDLTHTEVRVWRAAVRNLDFVDLRPLTLTLLEHTTRLSRAKLSRALGRLVELGFLIRGRNGGPHGAAQYRVPLSRAHVGGAVAAEAR